MIRRYLTCMLLAAVFSTPAFAESPTFSYLDLAYITAGDGADGAGLRAAAAIGSQSFIQLDSEVRDHVEGSFGHVSLGGGMRWPIIEGMEAAVGLAVNVVGGSFEEEHEAGWEGIRVGIGAGMELRARLNSRVEINAGARLDGVTDKLIPSAGARFYFSPRVAAGLRVVRDYFDTRVDVALHINLGD